MILTRQEKERLVIKLAEGGHSTRQIAKAAHVSLRDIGSIIRHYTGEEEEATVEPKDKSLTLNSRAFKLFKENKDLVDVAIALNMEADEVLGLHSDYLQLSNKDKLMSLYWEMGDDVHQLVYLYKQLEWYGLANRKDIISIAQKEEKLKNMDKVVFDTYGEIGRLNSIKMELEGTIEGQMKMMDHYDSVLMEKYNESMC